MSNGWDNCKPAPIEVFHGEAMKEFNREKSAKLLRQKGINLVSKNDGIHLVVENRWDF